MLVFSLCVISIGCGGGDGGDLSTEAEETNAGGLAVEGDGGVVMDEETAATE